MILSETALAGVFVVEPEPVVDDRGSFARVWCAEEFAASGVDAGWVQANAARSRQRGTLRGLHLQLDPHAETKLVRCTRGSLFDVVVDLRPGSPTRHEWFGIELGAEDMRSVLVPPGCAHGYLTLVDDTDVAYLTSAFYCREAERGVRYDDPAIGIEWPDEVAVIAERDRAWPLVEPGNG